MSEVIKGNFESNGFAIGDMRAIALQDWMAAQNGPVSVEAMMAEIERLKRIMPAPEDTR